MRAYLCMCVCLYMFVCNVCVSTALPERRAAPAERAERVCARGPGAHGLHRLGLAGHSPRSQGVRPAAEELAETAVFRQGASLYLST